MSNKDMKREDGVSKKNDLSKKEMKKGVDMKKEDVIKIGK
jgi:hypothetical protein